jgi:uncharacterized SAM-binding protein YcdF (DUF218 family)
MKYTIIFTTLILLGLLSACTSTKFAQKAYEKAKVHAPYDAVIVPGLPYDDSSNLNIILSARMLWSKKLFDDGITKNIIYSGAAVATPYIEGIAMKTIADSMGIPPSHTFAETLAEHSTENIWYSYLLAKKLGFKNIALATDPFQTKMLKRFLVKRCENMPFIPIVFIQLDPTKNRILPIPKINASKAFVKDFISLKDKESFFKRWAGTRGKHIDFNNTTY